MRGYKMKIARINSILLFSFVFGYMLVIPLLGNFEIDYGILIFDLYEGPVFNILPIIFGITLILFYIRFFKYEENKSRYKNKTIFYLIWFVCYFPLTIGMPITPASLPVVFSYGVLIFLFMISWSFDVLVWMGREGEISKSSITVKKME